MYDLEPIGLILLISLIVVGGGLFLKYSKQRKYSKPRSAKKHLPPVADIPDNTFETAIEFFPDFVFPSEPVNEPVPELPWGYDDNKITIMARDPEWIFAYWEISENKRHELKNAYGPRWDNSTPILRVYDITGIDYFNGLNANRHHDIVINEDAGSWYIYVGDPDRSFCVDLGRTLSDGTYIVLARSNVTSTPRNTISDKIDPQWMLVSENERKLLGRIGVFDGASSIDLFERQQH